MAIAVNNFQLTNSGRRNMVTVYRRRRAVVTLALAALAVSISFATLDSSASADRSSGGAMATPKFVIAESGDTLWAIAQRIAPNGDVVAVVDQLILLNGDSITTGQLVRIP